jgi:hypothetical protein
LLTPGQNRNPLLFYDHEPWALISRSYFWMRRLHQWIWRRMTSFKRPLGRSLRIRQWLRLPIASTPSWTPIGNLFAVESLCFEAGHWWCMESVPFPDNPNIKSYQI